MAGRKLASAFGMKLVETLGNTPEMSGGGPNAMVHFWCNTKGWHGELHVAGMVISEHIGSASAAACYLSLRGRVRNLANGLQRLGIDARPTPTRPRRAKR